MVQRVLVLFCCLLKSKSLSPTIMMFHSYFFYCISQLFYPPFNIPSSLGLQLLLAHFLFTRKLTFSLSSPLPSPCISSASVLQQLSSPLCVSDSDLLIEEDLLSVINLHCPCLRELSCHRVFYITHQPVW